MAKGAAREYIVVIGKSSASQKWLFVKNSKGKWSFPGSKRGLLDTHPILRAVKTSIGVFDDITNIELMFEISGEEIVVIVYQVLFEFDKTVIKESAWAHPLEMFANEDCDEMTKDIIDAIIQAFMQMKGKNPTKSQPLEIPINRQPDIKIER